MFGTTLQGGPHRGLTVSWTPSGYISCCRSNSTGDSIPSSLARKTPYPLDPCEETSLNVSSAGTKTGDALRQIILPPSLSFQQSSPGFE